MAPDRWATLADVQRTADRLNARAEQAKAYGPKVGHHNHDHAFTTTIDGRPALEVFADLLDPPVLLEFDHDEGDTLEGIAQSYASPSRPCSPAS